MGFPSATQPQVPALHLGFFFFCPLIVFTCVLTQPYSCGLCTPKAAEERDGWLEMSKGWLQFCPSAVAGM